METKLTFTDEQWRIGRRLLLDSANVPLLYARITPGGPAATALLINIGIIS